MNLCTVPSNSLAALEKFEKAEEATNNHSRTDAIISSLRVSSMLCSQQVVQLNPARQNWEWREASIRMTLVLNRTRVLAERWNCARCSARVRLSR
jgi:hypothetical protein